MAKKGSENNWCLRYNAATASYERFDCSQLQSRQGTPITSTGWVGTGAQRCCLPETCCFGCDVVDRILNAVNQIDTEVPSPTPYTSFTLTDFITAVNDTNLGITLVNDGSFYVDLEEYVCYGATSMTYQGAALPLYQCFSLINSVFCPNLSICFEVYNEQIGAEYFRRIRDAKICLPETGNPADIVDFDSFVACTRCQSINPIVPNTVTCPVELWGGNAFYSTTPMDRNLPGELTTAVRMWALDCCVGESYSLSTNNPYLTITAGQTGVITSGLNGLTFKVLFDFNNLPNGTLNWLLQVDCGPTCGQLIYNMDTNIFG